MRCIPARVALAVLLISTAKNSFAESSLESITQSPNQSYLGASTVDPFRETFALRDQLLGGDLNARLKTEYEDLVRDHDMRSAYGVNFWALESEHYKRVSDFQRYVLRSLVNRQVNSNFDKAEQRSSEVRTFRQAQRKLDSLSRQSVGLEMPQSYTKFRFKADVPRQMAYLTAQSPLADAQVDWRFSPHTFSLNPIEYFQSNPFSDPDERLKVSMTRTLPIWDLISGVTFGASTTRITTKLVKDLGKGWLAEVYSMRGIDAERSGLPKPEQVIRILYALRF